MAEPVTIRLGTRDFQIAPLTIGQLRQLLDAIEAVQSSSGGAQIEASAKIIHAGLASSEPNVTFDEILGIVAPVDEIQAAVAAILKLAGLGPREPTAGEAKPATVEASETGLPGSTLNSPPA